MSSWKMPFEMSGEFRLIPKHLGTRDFSRTSCQNTDMNLRLDWPRGRQNSNRSLPRIFGYPGADMMSRRNAMLAGIGLAGIAAFARNLFAPARAHAGAET